MGSVRRNPPDCDRCGKPGWRADVQVRQVPSERRMRALCRACRRVLGCDCALTRVTLPLRAAAAVEDGAVRPAEVASTLGITVSSVYAALSDAVADGHIRRVGRGHYAPIRRAA